MADIVRRGVSHGIGEPRTRAAAHHADCDDAGTLFGESLGEKIEITRIPRQSVYAQNRLRRVRLAPFGIAEGDIVRRTQFKSIKLHETMTRNSAVNLSPGRTTGSPCRLPRHWSARSSARGPRDPGLSAHRPARRVALAEFHGDLRSTARQRERVGLAFRARNHRHRTLAKITIARGDIFTLPVGMPRGSRTSFRIAGNRNCQSRAAPSLKSEIRMETETHGYRIIFGDHRDADRQASIQRNLHFDVMRKGKDRQQIARPIEPRWQSCSSPSS